MVTDERALTARGRFGIIAGSASPREFLAAHSRRPVRRTSPNPMAFLRRIFESRKWWLLPLLLLLLPLALILYFIWSTPNFADFEYKLF